MRYIVILKGTQPAGPPPEGLMNAIMDLGAEATSSGAMAPLAPRTRLMFGPRAPESRSERFAPWR